MRFLDYEFSGPQKSLVLIAGPCVVEDRDTLRETAASIAQTCRDLAIPWIFKASYRKANRSSIHSFTGIGDEKALEWLAEIKESFGVPVITDIHSEREASMAAEYVDFLQIPAFLCRQTELLLAAAQTGKPVAIKKGQFMSPEAMQHVVAKVRESGKAQVCLIERGTSFGYQDLIVDFRGIPVMQAFDVPVVVDCTHSLQQPNQAGGVTGGKPEFIGLMARTAIAAGADGIFIETHPEPSRAKSDGANMLDLRFLPGVLHSVSKIWRALEE